MSNLNRGLLAIVVVLGVTAGYLASMRPSAPRPPQAQLNRVDSISAAEIQTAWEQTRGDRPAELRALAEKYFAHGFYPESASCYARACRLSPDDASLHFDWAFTLAHAGLVEASTEVYQQALAIGAQDPKAVRYFLARDLLRRRDVERAMATLQEISDLPAADFELSRLRARQGELERARAALERLRKGNPEAAEFWYWSARVARQSGDESLSQRFADRANRARSRGDTPFNDQSLRWYSILESFGFARRQMQARGRLNAEQLGGLRESLNSLLQVSWYPAGVDALAELDMIEGRPQDAIERLQSLIEQDGATIDLCWRLGDAYALANRPREAEQAWLRGLTLGRGRYTELAGLHDTLAQWYERTVGDAERARQHRAASLTAAGMDQFRSGEYERASAQLENALRLNPTQPQAWFYLGECRRVRLAASPAAPGQSAADAYQKCLQLKPNHGRALDAVSLLKLADQ